MRSSDKLFEANLKLSDEKLNAQLNVVQIEIRTFDEAKNNKFHLTSICIRVILTQ